MPSWSTSLIYPLSVVLFTTFVIIRFQFFKHNELPGRLQVLFGSALLLASAIWQVVKGLDSYPDLFLQDAYLYIDLVQGLVFVTGAFTFVAGLAFYADFWQIRREDLLVQEQKLSILSTIQQDARDPYHLLELLDLALKEIVTHLPESSGMLFLINRKSRQFVLAASGGLTREETASFERYPYQRNRLSQVIEIGEAAITGNFAPPESGEEADSRFKCCLMIPLISGTERIGGLVLLSENSNQFGNSEVKYLGPVAEWLAEKIKTSRLTRELGKMRTEAQTISESRSELLERVRGTLTTRKERNPISGYCKQLVGLVGSDSVHLCRLSGGSVQFLGGSEPLLELSENYQTALINAIGKGKPLIVNQEVTDDSGRSHVSISSLLFPVGNSAQPTALLFRKESSPIKVNDEELGELQIFSQIVELLLSLQAGSLSSLARRQGFEQIIQLLQMKRVEPFADNPNHLRKALNGLLPEGSEVLLFKRVEEGSFSLVSASDRADDTLIMGAGEGSIGKVLVDLKPEFLIGRASVEQMISSFAMPARDYFNRVIGEQDLPSFAATLPVIRFDRLVGIVILLGQESDENSQQELERLVTLAVGMYNVGQTVNHLNSVSTRREVEKSGLSGSAEIINEINNRLASVIGQAELAAGEEALSGDVRQKFMAIVAESERTAEYVREFLTAKEPGESAPGSLTTARQSLGAIINDSLESWRISDDLYMIDGLPREINCRIGRETADLRLKGDTANLFDRAVSHFAALVQDDEVISIETYAESGYLFLDISRHRKNFPAVDKVSSFGLYQVPSEVLKNRPREDYLGYLSDDCAYSFDRFAELPSYISFRIPLGRSTETDPQLAGGTINVLAVDDQPLILDLLTAMCQSMEYNIETATNGDHAIELARKQEFDVVLTDLAMPGLSGLETARGIRHLQPQTPIILLTGWEATIEQSELDRAGITEVLYKPFRIEQLTELIRKKISEKLPS
ncbi:MAG: response regulator [bacterium]|nr:response regulator [bacterium]